MNFAEKIRVLLSHALSPVIARVSRLGQTGQMGYGNFSDAYTLIDIPLLLLLYSLLLLSVPFVL